MVIGTDIEQLRFGGYIKKEKKRSLDLQKEPKNDLSKE